LDPSQSRHAHKALRLKPGHCLEITGPWGIAPGEVVGDVADGAGLSLSPSDFSANRRDIVYVKITGPFALETSPKGPALALALIKGARFDWAVEKAAELGASSLTPLITERTNPSGLGQAKQARWVRLAEEARKQCGRPQPMRIEPPTTLSEYLAGSLPEKRFLLDPDPTSKPLPPCLEAALLAGPEGGLTDEEKALVVESGFVPASLGPLILRTETAALAGLARLTRPD
jgi:16S rRNA (uracil1498-N3)-methyltransferase